MPGTIPVDGATKKRKRAEPSTTTKKVKKVKPAKTQDADEDKQDLQSQMLALETQITESKKHYANIDTLVAMARRQNEAEDRSSNMLAAVTLTRVFCRLIAGERMVKNKNMSEKDVETVDALKAQFKNSVNTLCDMLHTEELAPTVLTLLMRLVKQETSQEGKRAEQSWRTGVFASVVAALVESNDVEVARNEFVESFVEEHDDVRYFTFYHIANILSRTPPKQRQRTAANALALLSNIEGIPDSAEQLEDWYGEEPVGPKHLLKRLSEHRKTAQEAWLHIFRSPLSKDSRKAILNILVPRIVPWFTKPENLSDFLTDSYDAGGSLSLLALSGLFHLINAKNLDYPAFYQKLYSLLDDNLLHSKHRSRFFRLLDTFLHSTHLPAALVASFIKRLARLALHAPPGAIVAIVPWTYNMLKKHPTCTFMLHRVPALHYPPTQLADLLDHGMSDPFNMTEPDPMETHATESSLWELQTLAQHYHPNVATLAGIMAEQFTKRGYELEDFLDYTYEQLVGGELEREIKRKPAAEWEIPKRVFTSEEGGLSGLGGLLEGAVLAM